MKARAITEQTYIDEVEVEEEGIAEAMMDDNTIADTASEIYHTHVILSAIINFH